MSWVKGSNVAAEDLGQHGPLEKLPALARPGPRPPAGKVEFTADDYAAAKAATESSAVRDLLRTVRPAESRFALREDLVQELAVKLWRREIRLEGLRTAARNWLLDWLEHESVQRQTAIDVAASAGVKFHRDPSLWEPRWYPPHDGKPGDPPNLLPSAGDLFACEGARAMHVSPSVGGKANMVEDALICGIDEGIRRKRISQSKLGAVSSCKGR